MPLAVIFFDLGDTLVTSSRTWIPGATQLIEDLKSNGLRIGIISNTGNLSRPDIIALLPPDFDVDAFESQLVLFSSEVGLAKPDPAIFQAAVVRADLSAADCLYCSESLTETEAAAQIGMVAIRVHSHPIHDLAELRRRLDELRGLTAPN